MADDVDEALKELSDSFAQSRQRQVDQLGGEERVKRDYRQWVDSVAFPTLQKIGKSLEEKGATVRVGKSREPEPTLEITVADNDFENMPVYTYMLFLHERTGPERAFAMKRRIMPNRDFGAPGFSEELVQLEDQPFWNENAGDPPNHAPDIKASDIVRDFTKEFADHQNYPWPAVAPRQQSGPGRQSIPSGFNRRRGGNPPRRG